MTYIVSSVSQIIGSSINIRLCSHKDIPSLVSLYAKAFEKDPGRLWIPKDFQSYVIEDDAQVFKGTQRIMDQLPGQGSLGVFERDTLRGAIVFQQDQEVCDIITIFVDPNYQGQGVAQRLLNELHTLNIQEFILEVRESNLKARRFYEKFGFVQKGVRRHYYQPVRGAEKDETEHAIMYHYSKK